MSLQYKSLHDGLNQAEINALYSILRKETIFTETLLMGTTGKYGIYNIVDTGIHVTNAIPTGQYTFNFSDGTVGVGVANDEGIVDVDISFDRSSVCDVVITFPQYVVRINYNLSLSGDKSIIQKDESVVVTALLTIDGSLVSGESLDYVVKHGNRVLDSGTITTGNDGTASITYTGTGVGDIEVIVSYGTLLQETYEILDCIKYYDGTISTTDYADKMATVTGVTATVDSTGTTLQTNTTQSSSTYFQIPFKNDNDYRNVPLCYEVDIIEQPTNFGLSFPIKLSDNTTQWWASRTGTDYGHLKVIITSEKAEYWLNDVKQWSTTASQIPVSSRCYFQSIRANGNGRIKFKNFVIYKIVDYDLTLSSDKDILSAHDGESATITALLTRDNVPTEDTELEYSIKHGNTVIDSGTITTNSDGEANIVYTATGVGDVSVEVTYGTLLQETYELEDTI